VLVDLGGKARILRNDQRTGHNWIAIGLADPAAFGAEIEVEATIRGKLVVQRRVLSPTRSYLAQNEPVASFGLGDATEAARVAVRLPNGAVREWTRLAAGRGHMLSVHE